MLDKNLPGDPETALVHEMAHAYGMTVAGERLTPQRRELDATAVENQYRDSVGLKQRSVYTPGIEGWNFAVPQYDRSTGSFFIHGPDKPYRLRPVP